MHHLWWGCTVAIASFENPKCTQRLNPDPTFLPKMHAASNPSFLSIWMAYTYGLRPHSVCTWIPLSLSDQWQWNESMVFKFFDKKIYIIIKCCCDSSFHCMDLNIITSKIMFWMKELKRKRKKDERQVYKIFYRSKII